MMQGDRQKCHVTKSSVRVSHRLTLLPLTNQSRKTLFFVFCLKYGLHFSSTSQHLWLWFWHKCCCYKQPLLEADWSFRRHMLSSARCHFVSLTCGTCVFHHHLFRGQWLNKEPGGCMSQYQHPRPRERKQKQVKVVKRSALRPGKLTHHLDSVAKLWADKLSILEHEVTIVESISDPHHQWSQCSCTEMADGLFCSFKCSNIVWRNISSRTRSPVSLAVRTVLSSSALAGNFQTPNLPSVCFLLGLTL